MSKTTKRSPFVEGVLAGLEEIILHAEGKIELKTFAVAIPDPPPAVGKGDIVSLRDRLKLTQLDFARLLNVPTSTLRLWESGKRKPSGAAIRLLQIYSERPDTVDFIVNGSSAARANRKLGKTHAKAKA